VEDGGVIDFLDQTGQGGSQFASENDRNWAAPILSDLATLLARIVASDVERVERRNRFAWRRARFAITLAPQKGNGPNAGGEEQATIHTNALLIRIALKKNVAHYQ
jgi:hypothetical protein